MYDLPIIDIDKEVEKQRSIEHCGKFTVNCGGKCIVTGPTVEQMLHSERKCLLGNIDSILYELSHAVPEERLYLLEELAKEVENYLSVLDEIREL